jgi:ribosomal protein S18 acetylase RimI-like enzyme
VTQVTDDDIRAARSADWPVAKDVRLRALADSPGAFGSTLAREILFDDAEWQARVASGTWFLAWSGTEAVGMAATITQDCLPDERHLVGMWVAPERRGSGVAVGLVEAVCRAARAAGAGGIVLWVADDNARAERFYRRNGFVETGDRQRLPSNPAVGEQRMRREL